MFDACGMAGGSPWAIGKPGWGSGGSAAAGVRYHNTTHAKQGDLGSKVLPAAPSGTVWIAGELAEVSWCVLSGTATCWHSDNTHNTTKQPVCLTGVLC
eukprot:COSAG05_NODE_2640_length_2812_cov_471.011680_2_plen_98_part_00